MKKIKFRLLAMASTAAIMMATTVTAETPEHSKKLYGQGLCARCELKAAEKCQTAIRVTEGDRKTIYYAADNQVAQAFHLKICNSVIPVKAIGNVQERDGKRHITLTHISLMEP